MSPLTMLPPEVLHHIFQWVRPEDLLLLPRVCRMFHGYVSGNRTLCRDVYKNMLDTPEDTELDWEAELRDIVRFEAICRRETAAAKKDELEFVSRTVNRLLKHASSQGHTTSNSHTHCASRNAEFLAEMFKEQSTCEAFLQRSFLFDRVRNEDHGLTHRSESVMRARQLSAKLHCLYGKPILKLGRLRATRTYPFAASKVYDLRQYTAMTKWGPFMDDTSDRVDWEKVEAIVVVLGYNLALRRVTHLFDDVWNSPFSGSWSKSYMPSPQTQLSSLDARDPYGVTGTWYRAVCFLDYNDFFNYNFPVTVDVPHDVPRPALYAGEATRLIIMRVHVTAVEPPGPEDGQDLPVVRFRGVSRALDDTWDDNANSNVREFISKGSVRLTKEGEVRWTTISIVHGTERWRSEGIQIGGIGSARGVVGNWFDKWVGGDAALGPRSFVLDRSPLANRDYDEHGPAGPTAFWKASETKATSNTIHELLSNDWLQTDSSLPDMEDSEFEAGMDYEDDGDEEEMDEYLDPEPVSNELPGLLLDAQLEVAELMQQQAGQGE